MFTNSKTTETITMLPATDALSAGWRRPAAPRGRKLAALLTAFAVVLSGYADFIPGQDPNSLRLVPLGTNNVLVITQGTNSVTFVTRGTNDVVTITQRTNAVTPPPKPVWNSLIAAGLSLTRGNSDTLLATAKIQTQKKDDHNEWLFQGDGAYGVNNSVKSADSLHGLGQENHLFTEKFYSYANADALHDGIQDLTYRVSISPGVGYYLIKTKPQLLSVEMGPGLLSEVRGSGEGNDTYMTLRMAEHWELKINPAAKLWEKVEILPEINRFDNYAANMEFGVDTTITKKLSLQVIFDDSFVNQPAAGRKANDVKLVSGIAYKF